MSGLEHISVIILAGGEGRRVGGINKGLLTLAGQPLIQHVLQAIPPQIQHIYISANARLQDYARFGYPVLRDKVREKRGPLAGVQAVLPEVHTPYLQLLTCDAPFFPADMIGRLHQCAQKHPVCVPHDGQRLQPLLAQMKTEVAHSIDDFLQQGERKVQHWLQRQDFRTVDFANQAEKFFNINTMEDLQQADNLL